MKQERTCTVVLHNIRSVYNVASIFRTADAAGVSRIILSGYTPAPIDRFGRQRRDFKKVSLGAERAVPWSQTTEILKTLKEFKAGGSIIYAIEQDPRSISLFDWKLEPKTQSLILVFGNEIEGLSKEILCYADTILEIPMRGKKESLNVSVSAGIALFALFGGKH